MLLITAPEVLRLSAFAVCVIEAIRGFFAHLGEGAEALILPRGLWKVLLGSSLHHPVRT